MMVNYFKGSKGDRVLMTFIYLFLFIFFILVAYPLIYVVSSSFSSVQAIQSGQVWFLPIEPNVRGYTVVFENRQVWTGYMNSLLYTVLGTGMTLTFTVLAAYPLSRSDFGMRNVFMALLTFTMFFGGGMIPSYLLIRNLKMLNTVLVMVLPGALNVWYIILMRTYFKSSIPASLQEAAQLDGCSDVYYLIRIVVPLSAPIVAVIALFSAVGIWNSYFNALIYLNSQNRYPLQIILRNILILNQLDNSAYARMTEQEIMLKQGMADLMKYSLIVVASAPMLMIYPFVQKYFIRGIMIGSIKG